MTPWKLTFCAASFSHYDHKAYLAFKAGLLAFVEKTESIPEQLFDI